VGKQAKQRRDKRTQRQTQHDPGDLLGALELLERRRAPYAALLAAIAGDALVGFPVGAGQGDTRRPIVEIGAGTGQLRAWLPREVAARVIHTDPASRALELLRRGTGGAGDARDARDARDAPTVAAARAQALPFADGSCDGVIGLCVFDAIHAAGAEAAAVAEMARVLPVGGCFVHMLDMATLLDAPLAKLSASGLVPIPNVFSDPADHEWPLDVLLLRRDWLTGLLDLTARARHPLAVDFAGFFEPFLAPTFVARVAADRFKTLAASGQRRLALSSQIASACRLAVEQGYPTLPPLPFHSGRYLASLLETTFRDSGAFRIDQSQVVTRSAWGPLSTAGDSTRYRSLALGHERVLQELPARLLDESARSGEPAAPSTLTEAAAYVFVATKLA
jgi:SAM-dependent methyltransferase